MAKFKWDGATGDNAKDSQKVNWKEDTMLPAPPRKVFDLLNRATSVGYWLKWAKSPRVLALWGSRYKLTRAGCNAVVYASDDLSAIEECIAEFEDG